MRLPALDGSVMTSNLVYQRLGLLLELAHLAPIVFLRDGGFKRSSELDTSAKKFVLVVLACLWKFSYIKAKIRYEKNPYWKLSLLFLRKLFSVLDRTQDDKITSDDLSHLHQEVCSFFTYKFFTTWRDNFLLVFDLYVYSWLLELTKTFGMFKWIRRNRLAR